MNAALRCVCSAPAKLNTRLEVLGRRDDGFHELVTDMVAIAPCDLVEVRAVARDEGRVPLVVEGPAASDDVRGAADDNLAVRAVRGYLAAARALDPHAADLAFAVRLLKLVPSRAGLGGASADAAAALLACDEVVAARGGRRLGPARLLELAAAHGSDTVFFLAARFGGVGTARGRGERVAARGPAPRRDAWFALVVPDLGCSTPAVYGAFADGARGPRAGSPRRNDLERAALAVEPALADWFDALGPRFGLSGSGAALFAAAADAREAQALVDDAARAAARLGRTPRLVVATRALGHGVRPLVVPGSAPGTKPGTRSVA